MSRKPGALLHAVAVAAPLCEPVAFGSDLLAVRRDAVGAFASKQLRALTEACQTRLRRHGRGRSLRELDLIRDRAWFGDVSGRAVVRDVRIASILERYASGLVRVSRAGEVTMAGDATRPNWEIVRDYRWATLMLPWDLLAVAAARGTDLVAVPLQRPHLLEFLRPSEACEPRGRLAAEKWGEQHLHLAAAVEFTWAWAGLMQQAYCGSLDLAGMPRDSAVPGSSLEGFRDLLHEAAVVRAFLVLRHANCSDGDLLAKLGSRAAHWLWVRSRWSGEPVPSGALRGRGRAFCLDGLNRWLDRSRPDAERNRETVDGFMKADPLWKVLRKGRPSGPLFLPEHSVLAIALELASTDSGPAACIALNYVRAFAWTYRYIVQEPSVSGLAWFGRHYQRVDSLVRQLEPIRRHAAHALQSGHCDLSSLEVRTTPNRISAKLRMPWPEHDSIAAGLVAHFIRLRPKYADWHGHWFESNRSQASAVREVIERPPQAWRGLWGLDAANDELATPTWLEAALFHHVWLGLRSGAPVGLGITLHAGEEYRTELEGLRRIDRAIKLGDHLRSHVPDTPPIRLGHALALLDSRSCCAHPGDTILQPAFERLCDLWWAHGLSQEGRAIATPARRHAMCSEILRLSRALQLDSLPSAPRTESDSQLLLKWVLWLITSLHNPAWIVSAHVRATVARQEWDPVAALLANPVLAERARQPVEVRIDSAEEAFSKAARKAVRDRARAVGATIEACPSSNLIVADHAGLGDHPMHDPVNEGLQISINSDDPLTFATCLADERAYAVVGAVERGKTVPEALKWLERRRLDGLQSSFGPGAVDRAGTLR